MVAIGIFAAIFITSVAGLVLSTTKPTLTQTILRVLLSVGIVIGLGGAAYNIYARTNIVKAKKFAEWKAESEALVSPRAYDLPTFGFDNSIETELNAQLYKSQSAKSKRKRGRK